MTTSKQFSRRGVLLGAAAAIWASGGRARSSSDPVRDAAGAKSSATPDVADHIAELEKREGGRLGVAVLDTGSGKGLQHRANERFPLCSTFKYLAAAAVLHHVDRGEEHLDRWLPYGESDLLTHAPVSKEHVNEHGMRLDVACAAAVQVSDNTAANLILKILGGPAGLTQYFRSLGDRITRLDRFETALNAVKPGEVHDTTTPAAMLKLLRAVLLGDALSPESRKRLETWMLDAKVGEHRLPAGLPPGWRIAHKTGTWDDETNDVGVVWPPERAPILVAAFYSQGVTPQERREAVLADVGKIVASAF